ncbi:unnamed protein product [Peniophora sp. CBMAI 1063]|nr:unnamed protein product [Peniophora sp. CBMAI 1063]
MFATRPNRTLLNPKFEGYKLDALEEPEHVFRHVLDSAHRPRQATVSGRSLLSFHEVQSRIRHNHLCIGPDGRRAVYVDGELKVVLVEFGEDLQPTYNVLHEMSMPMFTDGAARPQKEYASAAFLNGGLLAVADGFGTLYFLDLPSTSGAPSTLRGTFELPAEAHSSSPFRIHAAVKSGEDQALLILSSSSRQSADDASTISTTSAQPRVYFDVFCAELPLASASSEGILNVRWRLRGQDAPLYVAYEAAESVFLLAGAARYQLMDAPATTHAEPSADEAAPIPRAGENLDALSNDNRPPPYAWTQDNEEVTVAFPLPATTPSNAISVNFSPQTLTLRVRDTELAPQYTTTRLWAGISPDNCLWTWDAKGHDKFGLLTLHIEKQHSGTRWPSVFDATSGQPEVPETLDPSALAEIREAMEKFTAGAAGGGPGAVPSLAEGERDDEADTAVGNDTALTWAKAADGCAPEWAASDMDGEVTVLSTPLPGIAGISLVAKHTIDGLLFAHSTRETSEWTHSSTYSALAFVLASKRDTRFVHHIPGSGVLALEGGTETGGGNVYVYRDAPRGAKHAKQAILRVGGGGAGALLGVGSVRDGDKIAIACLCENELVVLRGVL